MPHSTVFFDVAEKNLQWQRFIIALHGQLPFGISSIKPRIFSLGSNIRFIINLKFCRHLIFQTSKPFNGCKFISYIFKDV